jgi:MFS transporter, FSR family, fosmidomycin resistance protein
MGARPPTLAVHRPRPKETMSDVRIIALVAAAHMVSHFLQLTLPPLFPLLKSEFDVPYVALGLVMTAFYAASGFGQTVSGFLVDRFGARRILLTGMTVFAVAIGVTGLVPSYWMLLPVAAVAGAGNSVFHPADYAIFNASVSSRWLARAYGIHSILGTVGWVVAPVVVVTVAGIAGWRTALLVAGSLALLAALVVAQATRPLAGHQELRGRPAAQPLVADVRLLLSAPIVAAFAYFTLMATALIGIQTFAVTAMVTIYGAPIGLATGALTAFYLGNAGGILVGGILADRTHRHDVVAATGMLLAAVFTMVVGTGGVMVALLSLVMGLAGLSLGLSAPSRDMLVRGATPRGASGKVFGFVYSGLDVGSLAGPPVYGWLLDRGEPRAMFVVVAVLMVVTIATVVHVRRQGGAAPAPALS